MIELRHVFKTYPGPIHALKNIDLFVDKGEFVFLTGPSGAGKSTLFRLIAGLDRVSSGKIEVGGFDLAQLSASNLPYFRRRIGVVFQDFKLLPDRSVFENISLPLVIKGEKPNQIIRKVGDALEAVALSHRADHKPAALSGGEQQRVAIARAMIHQPGVLIADEPTGNLDPYLAEEIMDLLVRVCSQGTTVFVATHDHDMVHRRKKRRIEISQGQIVTQKIEEATR